MCVYGIGLPFDHPIWQNLPPCRCYTSNAPVIMRFDYAIPQRTTTTVPVGQPPGHSQEVDKRARLQADKG